MPGPRQDKETKGAAYASDEERVKGSMVRQEATQQAPNASG